MSTLDPHPPRPLARWLYVSRVADGTSPASVSQILRQSREHNRDAGIGGALLFDGERFAQLLEGSPEAIRQLAGRITADDRHASVTVLHEAVVDEAPLLPCWKTGYCEPGLLQALQPDVDSAPADALQTFLGLLVHAELSA